MESESTHNSWIRLCSYCRFHFGSFGLWVVSNDLCLWITSTWQKWRQITSETLSFKSIFIFCPWSFVQKFDLVRKKLSKGLVALQCSLLHGKVKVTRNWGFQPTVRSMSNLGTDYDPRQAFSYRMLKLSYNYTLTNSSSSKAPTKLLPTVSPWKQGGGGLLIMF